MRLNNNIFASTSHENALVKLFQDPISLKSLFVFASLVWIIVLVVIVVRQNLLNPKEKTPQNLKKFHNDEILETKRLERTLATALAISAVLAVSLALYWMWEPNRQTDITRAYEQKSVRRGQTLYAKEGDPGFSSTSSLGCSGCHGGYNPETKKWSEGGTASYVISPMKDPATSPECKDDNKFRNPDCVSATVSWKAPALNMALYNYPIIKSDPENPFKSACSLEEQRVNPDCRSQVYDIIVYGRPGTPMPAWGTAGGGPKNEQSIQDLMAFLSEIQVSKKEAMSYNEVKTLRESALKTVQADLETAEKNLKDSKTTVAETQAAYNEAKIKFESDGELNSFANPQDYLDQIKKDQTQIKLEKEFDLATGKARINASKKLNELKNKIGIAKTFIEARDALAAAKATNEIFAPLSLENAKNRLNSLKSATDGQILFENNCARCHTKGWSFADYTNGRVPTPQAAGSGAFGPALNHGSLLSQFPEMQSMVDFISKGSLFQKPYGTRGIGTGRMPGFENILSQDQIKQIVEYERQLENSKESEK